MAFGNNTSSSSSSDIQTSHSSIDYAATAVVGTSFTHSTTQGTTSPNVFIEPINIVRTNLGDGTAVVRLFIDSTYWGNDGTITVSLPTGTLHYAFNPTLRAFRDELNVADYIICTATTDSIAINRDNNITGDSPNYLVVEGIGDWIA